MSVQALGWVFDHSPTQGTDRLVLLALANHAGKDPDGGAWECWPGTATIQNEAGLDRHRTVRDALGRLEAAGAIERIVNGAPDERIRRDRRSNLYRVLLSNGRTCGDPRCGWCGGTRDDQRGDVETSNGGTRDDGTGGRGASPKPSVEPSTEPEDQPRALRLVDDEPFDAFWRLYPRRVGRPSAVKAWTQIIRASSTPDSTIEAIMGGLGPWVRYWDARNEPQYVPHPSTWLNRRGWEDAPPPIPRRGNPRGPGWVSDPAEDAVERSRPTGRIVDL